MAVLASGGCQAAEAGESIARPTPRRAHAQGGAVFVAICRFKVHRGGRTFHGKHGGWGVG